MCGAETGTLRKVDRKCLDRSEVWFWRSSERIIWSDRMGNEVVLHRGKRDRNVLCKIKNRKAKYVGQILLRNCRLKHVMEEKIRGRT